MQDSQPCYVILGMALQVDLWDYVFVGTKGLKEMQIELPIESVTFRVEKLGETFELKLADCDPDGIAYLLRMGFSQSLQHTYAAPKGQAPEGKELRERIESHIAKVRNGEAGLGHGGGRQLDPVERELREIAAQAFKKSGRWKLTAARAELTKDFAQAMLTFAVWFKAVKGHPAEEAAIAKAIEAKWLVIARENVRKRQADDTLADIEVEESF